MDINEFQRLASRLRPRLLTEIAVMLGSEPRAEMADDIVQETLIRLWTIRERLDSVRSPGALAVTIARRRCIDFLRTERPGRISLEQFDGADDAERSALEAIIEAESVMAADRILSRLPKLQQAVMRMRHIDGMEVDEIAAVIGGTSNSVRVNLSRARRTVKEIFLSDNKSELIR